MNSSAKTPCEAIVWYVLPVLRREMARELVGLGKNQREAAGLLGVTEAAVSQYMAAKRGSARWLDATIRKKILASARRIAAGSPVPEELCGLCAGLKLAGTVASLGGPRPCHAAKRLGRAPKKGIPGA